MKKLFLLRHCQSDMGPADKERVLSGHGVNEGRALGTYLKEQGVVIDHVLCSSAQRTCETLQGVVHGGADIRGEVEFVDRLYNASAGEILNCLQMLAEKHESVLIVAHNPGIHQAARVLSNFGDEEMRHKQTHFCAPGTLSGLECPIESWANVQISNNELVMWIDPSGYCDGTNSYY